MQSISIQIIPPISDSERRNQRNHEKLRALVHNFWINGLLKTSPYAEIRIHLQLVADIDAINKPWGRSLSPYDLFDKVPAPESAITDIYQQYDLFDEVPAPESAITDIYQQLGQSFLILGEPGSGKSVTLLELTDALLHRAAGDPEHPTPVLFSLSSWENDRKPFEMWLVSELCNKYHIPLKLAQRWVIGNEILPLLDGFDEIPEGHRPACLEAINRFLQDHLTALIICSHTSVYMEKLVEAIGLKLLPHEQSEHFLETFPKRRVATDMGSQKNSTRQYYKARSDLNRQRNRQSMLRMVGDFWIDGVLKHSLHDQNVINLDMEQYPGAIVMHPWLIKDEPSAQADRLLPHGTQIVDIFAKHNQSLLILGAPGSGKTTQLLMLARDLLFQAEQDPTSPIPVIFNLSLWGIDCKPLEIWLVSELNDMYRTPKKLAQSWIEQDELLFLLDGFDEVPEVHRLACLEAINRFLQDHLTGVVICSRTTEYMELPKRLKLFGAIEIKPLALEQVEHYLTTLGEDTARFRNIMREDSSLQEMVNSPLMLQIATTAYVLSQEQKFGSDNSANASRNWRDHLLSAYVDRMFEQLKYKRFRNIPYSKSQMTKWLHWLARNLLEKRYSIFTLDQMEQDWLQSGYQALIFRIATAATFGLLYGIVVWIAFFILFGVGFAMLAALILGTAFGVAWVGWRSDIDLSGVLTWIPRSNQWLGVIFGILLGIVCGWLWGPLFGFSSGLFMGLAVILALGIGEMNGGITTSDVSGTYGIIGKIAKRSLGIGSVFGIATALLTSLGLGLLPGLALGFLFGGGVGLALGGSVLFQHYILRLVLFFTNESPYDLIGFLNLATDFVLLRKVGNGYIFIHRLLLEHFASYKP